MKRSRLENEDFSSDKRNRLKNPHEQAHRDFPEADGALEARFLMLQEEAPVVIGKGGENAKRIRGECRVQMTITRLQNTAGERICRIRGSPSSIASAVEKIATLQVTNADQIFKKRQIRPTKDDETCITLLVHEILVGVVIGKGGALAKQIAHDMNARMKVDAEVIGDSTDRACRVTGTPQALSRAFEAILSHLLARPLKPGTRTRPYLEDTEEPRRDERDYRGNHEQDRYHRSDVPPPPPSPERPWDRVPPPPPPPSERSSYGELSSSTRATHVTERVIIPATAVGAVIGPGGHVTRGIQERTGCVIAISPPDASVPEERMISITGPQAYIEAAIRMIQECVETFQGIGPPPTHTQRR